MAPSRKRHAVEAPHERWQLLGELAQARRQEMGYRHRPGFARDRLPLTEDGNPNVRLAADFEMAYRDTFPPGTLRDLARAYDVAWESVLAVLRGDADALAPARGPSLPPAPMADPAREAATRPYADPIWERLLSLAAAGVTDPPGARLFPRSPADANAWDGTAGRMGTADRVWLVAELQRRGAPPDPQGRAQAG